VPALSGAAAAAPRRLRVVLVAADLLEALEPFLEPGQRGLDLAERESKKRAMPSDSLPKASGS